MPDLNLRAKPLTDNLRVALLLMLCLGLVGCTTLSRQKKIERQKDREIAILKNLLKDKEKEIQEKDRKIENLRKQLESFGVFSAP